jgi:hypothetical protein
MIHPAPPHGIIALDLGIQVLHADRQHHLLARPDHAARVRDFEAAGLGAADRRDGGLLNLDGVIAAADEVGARSGAELVSC